MTESDTVQQATGSIPKPTWMPYTRTGDTGETSIGNYARVSKADPRIEAYGDCEEVTAYIGLTINLGSGLTNAMVRVLTRVQNDLVDLSADICAPIEGDDADYLRIGEAYISRLERACDHFNEGLTPPPSFIVSGGTTTAASLYYACTLARRAERTTANVVEHDRAKTNPLTGTYLNRLANLLLVLARSANEEHGETPWEPGLTTRMEVNDLWDALPGEPPVA